jgi:2-succinyl-5-enolpyruvyl-6-hydroxy-3-cyclohexene-1-carboxylate synthase
MQFKFCQYLVKALKEAGCIDVVICPGSRNAPLIQAFSESTFNVYSQIDERSAGYIALGLTKASAKATVICCSSGTAVANLLPAAIEAQHQSCELVFLTADRPEGEYLSYANQSINQINIFKDHIKKVIDVSANRQDALSQMKQFFKHGLGSSHINVRLVEPLYDFKSELSRNQSKTPKESVSSNSILPGADVTNHKNVLVITGFGSEVLSKEYPNLVIYADPCSPDIEYANTFCLEHYIDELLEGNEIDLLITTGRNLLSKKLREGLKKSDMKVHLHFDSNENYISPYQTTLFNIYEPSKIDEVLGQLKPNKGLKDYVQAKENECKKKILQLTKDNVVMQNLSMINAKYPDMVLHAGNSMAVRYAAIFNAGLNTPRTIIANRGTAGIDGSLSTFLGYCMNDRNRHHVLLIGDLSTLYDNNGFLLQPRPNNFTIVVLNNKGGFIFRMVKGTKQLSESAQNLQKTSRDVHLNQMFKYHGLSSTSISGVIDPDEKSDIIELVLDNENETSQLLEFWT